MSITGPTLNAPAYQPASEHPGTPFPYPGNKTRLSEWILSVMRDHKLFVAPFAGGGGLLFNKTPSKNEVINDVNGDITTFFRVLRDRHDELKEYLSLVPYAEDQYDEWKAEWDRGWRPSDDVKHAAIFYFLRRASFGADVTGFRAVANGRKNSSTQFYNSLDRLEDFSERLKGVIIHNRDYVEIIEKYKDNPDVLFYLDPPYANASERYDSPGFFPLRFSQELGELSGHMSAHWILSSMNVPMTIDCYPTLKTDLHHQINNENGSRGVAEKLTLSYDPDDTPLFTSADTRQEGIGKFS
jgi:site-specific DNA-adenine methylase